MDLAAVWKGEYQNMVGGKREGTICAIVSRSAQGEGWHGREQLEAVSCKIDEKGKRELKVRNIMHKRRPSSRRVKDYRKSDLRKRWERSVMRMVIGEHYILQGAEGIRNGEFISILIDEENFVGDGETNVMEDTYGEQRYILRGGRRGSLG